MKVRNMFEIAILAIILVFAASCGENKKNTPTPVAETFCHTELVTAPLETAAVADQMVVRTGQSISGLVKDHQKNIAGYTREMFLADNPEIASRTPHTKLDPCDSSKVKYTAIPIYAGDVVFLRYPYKIDTIPGGDETSVMWEAAQPGRLRHIIDMDDEGRFIVHDNSFVCDKTIVPPTDKEEIILPPSDDEAGLVSPPKGDGSDFCNFIASIPNWLWFILGLLLLMWFIWYQHRRTRKVVNGHTTTDGNQTRERVATTESQIRAHVTTDGDKTRSEMSEVAKAITEQTVAVKAQTEAVTKSSNELLEAIRAQGGLSGRGGRRTSTK